MKTNMVKEGLLVIILVAMTTADPELHDDWPEAELSAASGHYPGMFCTLTHAVLNSSEASFIYKSSSALHHVCHSVSDIWSLKHNRWLHHVDCQETYDVGLAFTIYYWHGSNYFHLHTDVLLPLYFHFYHNSDNVHVKAAFMPTVETRRLEKLDWDTPAFQDSSKYWMQIVKMITGRNKLKPLHRSILGKGKNICFKKIYFGTPDIDFSDRRLIQDFVKFVKHHFQIEDTEEMTDRLAIDHRLGRRQIINIQALADAVRPFIAVDLVNFSGMSFRAQVALMQKYTIFVALNGAGLMNSLYLPPHAVSVQLVPYKSTLNFEEYSVLLRSRGPYMEWHNNHKDLHVRHSNDEYDNRPDTIVNVTEFIDLIKAAMYTAQKARNSGQKVEL